MYFLHLGAGYRFYGPHLVGVNMAANSLTGTSKGHPVVEFENTKSKIYIIWMHFQLLGTALGERQFNATGRCFIFDAVSRVVCEIIYNPNDKGLIGNLFSKKSHKIDEIAGAIYRVKPEVIERLLAAHKYNSKTCKGMAIDP